MPRIRPPVPASQWDRVYGNSDGALSLDERGVALTTETVRERYPELNVEIRTEMPRDPTAPFRAGGTYRDEFGVTNVRIYPGAVGASTNLVPYIVGHELGHVVLSHLDRPGPSKQIELEAEWFAGRTLAQFGEDLEVVIAELTAQGGNADTHGAVDERIAAIRRGYAEAMAELQSGRPVPLVVTPVVAPTPVVTPAPVRPEPSTVAGAADRLFGAIDDLVAALREDR